MTDKERFDRRWTPEPNTGCWLWLGALNPKGYGQHQRRGHGSHQAHRHAWELYRAPIPAGMVIDHVCRVRSCVNPDHLRVVTPLVNSTENSVSSPARNGRKTHCLRGHPLSGDNLYVKPGSNLRNCRACRRAQHVKWADRPHNADTRRLDVAQTLVLAADFSYRMVEADGTEVDECVFLLRIPKGVGVNGDIRDFLDAAMKAEAPTEAT